MFEVNEANTAAALRELALEDEAAIDRAVDATAESARGRSLLEVETMLRNLLSGEGLDLGEEVVRIAGQIVRAVEPSAPA